MERYRAIHKHVYDIDDEFVIANSIEEAVELYRKIYPYETINQITLVKPANASYGSEGFAIFDAEPLQMREN